MTKQEYTKYTGSAYMSTFKNPANAIELARNKYNVGKTKIIMLEDGVYGVAQNSLANKFISAGYERFHYGFAELALLNQ